MPIIYRYIIGQIMKYVLIVLAAVVGIYLAVDFFQKIDNFKNAGLPVSSALVYFLYKLPFIIAQMLPVCLLLSVIIVLGLMQKNKEIIALKSSGIGMGRILIPILSLGLLFSLFLFFFSEVLVPVSSGKANRIWSRDVKKQSAVISRTQNIWRKEKRRIINIRHYDQAKKMIFGVVLHGFDAEFRLARRVDAETGRFQDGKWHLTKVAEQVLDPESGTYKISFHDQYLSDFTFSPEGLQTVVKKSEEIRFTDLFEYVRKMEEEGYDAAGYRTDLQGKIAFPFICLVMCIVGCGILVTGKLREGLPIGIAYGIGVAFFYWVVYSTGISLGHGEKIPPFFAAWTANILFAAIGIYSLSGEQVA